MTRPRSRVVAAAATLTVGALLAACSSGSTGAGAGAEAPSGNPLDDVEGVTTVSFWHSMEGTNGQNLDALVAGPDLRHRLALHDGLRPDGPHAVVHRP
jgi:sn-glycerol 3-phosphate transport system substrate-binding protein